MDTKTCSMCSFEKHIINFYKTYTGNKDCNHTRALKGYYENRDKISNQQEIYYEKKEKKY